MSSSSAGSAAKLSLNTRVELGGVGERAERDAVAGGDAGAAVDVVIVRVGDDRDRLHGSDRPSRVRIHHRDPPRRPAGGVDEHRLRRLEPFVPAQLAPGADMRQSGVEGRMAFGHFDVQEKRDERDRAAAPARQLTRTWPCSRRG